MNSKQQQAQKGGRKNPHENETASTNEACLGATRTFKTEIAMTVRFMLLHVGQMSN